MRARLSEKTEQIVKKLFPPDIQEIVHEILLHQCGNQLPFLRNADEFQLERYRFAALKLSQSNLEKLDQAVKVAKEDWRDLLMAAGFGHNVLEHENWDRTVLGAISEKE